MPAVVYALSESGSGSASPEADPPLKDAAHDDDGLLAARAPALNAAHGQRSRRHSLFERQREQRGRAEAARDALESSGQWLGRVQLALAPNAPARIVWNIYVALLILYTMVMVPFAVAFDFYALRPPALVSFDIAADLSFLADVLLNLVSPFEEEDPHSRSPRLVFSLRRIAVRYAQRWLVPDVLSSIPADLLGDMAHDSALRIIKILRLLKIAHVLRLARMLDSLRRLRAIARLESRVRLYPGSGRLLALVGWVALIAHWFSCLQFLVASWDGHFPSESWVVAQGLQDAPVGDQYLNCLYWVLTTLATIGYGDITPGSNREKAVTLVMFLVGATVFAFLISTVTGLAASLDRAAAIYRERLDAVTGFLRYHQVPFHISHRIKTYYEHFLRGSLAFDEGRLFGDLSESLRTELAIFRHKDLITKSELFQKVQERRFLERVVLLLRRCTFAPGDRIFHQGERGSEMYFVALGSVRIEIGPAGAARPVAALPSGSFFGEIATLTDSVRTAHAVAAEYTELYSLSKGDLASVLEDYPDIADELADVALRRLENMHMQNQAGPGEDGAPGAAAGPRPSGAGASAPPARRLAPRRCERGPGRPPQSPSAASTARGEAGRPGSGRRLVPASRISDDDDCADAVIELRPAGAGGGDVAATHRTSGARSQRSRGRPPAEPDAPREPAQAAPPSRLAGLTALGPLKGGDAPAGTGIGGMAELAAEASGPTPGPGLLPRTPSDLSRAEATAAAAALADGSRRGSGSTGAGPGRGRGGGGAGAGAGAGRRARGRARAGAAGERAWAALSKHRRTSVTASFVAGALASGDPSCRRRPRPPSRAPPAPSSRLSSPPSSPPASPPPPPARPGPALPVSLAGVEAEGPAGPEGALAAAVARALLPAMRAEVAAAVRAEVARCGPSCAPSAPSSRPAPPRRPPPPRPRPRPRFRHSFPREQYYS
eukprot:tig00001127_g7159.t1